MTHFDTSNFSVVSRVSLCLDLEIDSDEIVGVSKVSVDAADFGGGEDDVMGFCGSEKGVYGGLVGEIQSGM